MQDAQKLYRLGDDVSGVRLKLVDPLAAPQMAHEFQQTTQRQVWFSDWTQENANYFRAVEIEKRMMFVILTLIVAVAAFNLVSSLVMAVTDKQADIAILRTLGASPASIMGIFVIQGATVGIIGTLLGVAGGTALGYTIGDIVHFFERLSGVQILSPQVYLISLLPSEVELSDVLQIGVISLVLALLATLYPSWRASRINPAEALRYE
jgi:lipoprotein-releasing system permease protein